MKTLFIVQGEGRGHLTQALALRSLLRRAGHRVAAALVGCPPHRTVPAFFREGIAVPVEVFESPGFVADAGNRSVQTVRSLVAACRRADRFRRSLQVIDTAVRRYRPDLIVNFFEPLAGLYARWYRPAAPMVCIAHQYMFQHPAYRFPAGRRMEAWALQQFTRITTLGAVRRLALSFYPAADLPEEGLTVMPPLLRPALFTQREQPGEAFLLLYLLNSGYAADVIRWHARRPDVALHCFWDRPGAPAVQAYDETLTFHQLDGPSFLSHMARCGGLACTAGFESVCEAMYLGKPVLMVPVAGHFEQQCNGLDAAAAGAGLCRDRFDLGPLLELLPRYRRSHAFRDWVRQGGTRFLKVLERIVGVSSSAGYDLAADVPSSLFRVPS